MGRESYREQENTWQRTIWHEKCVWQHRERLAVKHDGFTSSHRDTLGGADSFVQTKHLTIWHEEQLDDGNTKGKSRLTL